MYRTEERWINMSEACDYLGITRPTMTEWIKNKDLPAVKIGKAWRFKISEIDEWMEQRRGKIGER